MNGDDMWRITNETDINFMYFAGCQAARSVNNTHIANEFARRGNIHLVVASDVNTGHNVGRNNYIEQLVQDGYHDKGGSRWVPGGEGFMVFWTGMDFAPRILSQYNNLGDLISHAKLVREEPHLIILSMIFERSQKTKCK